MKIKAMCFDMDGTLIRNTNSVEFLRTLNNNLDQLEEIARLEHNNSIPWVEADHLKAKLITGLDPDLAKRTFNDHIRLIAHMEQVLTHLQNKQVKSVLITAGPIQVANIVGAMYGFDGVYGSLFEVTDRAFTGKITTHLGQGGKLSCLMDFCTKNGIGLNQCIAIGDSESDIDVFRACRKSIAINYSDALRGEASEYIVTEDLADIIDILDEWMT